MLVTIAGAGLGYLSQVLLARQLGPEGYGDYTYSTAWLNAAQLLGSLDMAGAALRFVGVYTATGAWGLLRGFVRRGRALVAGTSVLVALGGVTAVLALGGRIGLGRRAALLVTCAAVVPSALLLFESNLLIGLRRTLAATVPTAVVRPLVLLTALAVALGVGRTLSPAWVLGANGAALCAAAALSVWWTERVRPNASRHPAPETRTGEWVRMSLAQLSGSVLQMVLTQQSDVIIVGSLIGSGAAGLYSVANQLASLVLFGVSLVNHFAAPRLAAYVDDPRSSGLGAEVHRISLLNWALALPLAAVFAAAGPWILRTFGPGYVAAYPALCVMLVSQVVSATWGGLAGTMLGMIGYHHAAAVLIGVAAAVNLALTAVLTPRYGIVGAAWATTIAITVRALAMQVVVLRSTGLWLLPGRTRVSSPDA